MRDKNILFLAAIFACLIFFGAGCAAYQSSPAAINQTPEATAPVPAAPAPSANQPSGETYVNISNFSFQPQVVTVAPGATIVWKNMDGVPHHILSQGSFESSDLNQGDEYRFTFLTTGTFDYICKIHPSMQGRIIVKP